MHNPRYIQKAKYDITVRCHTGQRCFMGQSSLSFYKIL